MNFWSAIERCFRNYATFSGRARRSEYWFFSLFTTIVAVAAIVLDAALGTSEVGVFYLLTIVGLFLPGLAVAGRRLHDLDRSGWWYLIGIVPLVGAILLLVWFCTAGTDGPNRFGDDPLYDEETNN